MASSAWKGFISFGLISIPVRLYGAARSSTIRLHQVHNVCKTRLKQPLFCPTCNRVVERPEVVKGYQDDDGNYILLDPAEVKAMEPESAHNMEILSFVEVAQIDPLFFDSSYFMVPEEQGRKAYQLLLKTLENIGRVGIAKVTIHQREHTVFIRPYDRGLTVHTMYYENEIRKAPGYGKTEDIKLNPQEVQLANQLVDTLSEDFHVDKYHDDFQDRLKALIQRNQKGKQPLHGAPPQGHRAPVIDMMAALKKSLAAAHSQPERVSGPKPNGTSRRRMPHRVAS
jgi:DNA end-binding protein Ku